jgi:predicted outer membrane repeat protein
MTLTRKKGLTPTGFRRKQGSPLSSFGPGKPFGRKSGIKAKRKKVTVAEGSKFIDACRGEECFLLVPGVCCSVGWAHPSVVDCHSNQSRHGKGGAIKAQNIFTVPGCERCHEFIDRGPAPRAEKFELWDDAYARWVPRRDRKMGINQLETA